MSSGVLSEGERGTIAARRQAGKREPTASRKGDIADNFSMFDTFSTENEMVTAIFMIGNSTLLFFISLLLFVSKVYLEPTVLRGGYCSEFPCCDFAGYP